MNLESSTPQNSLTSSPSQEEIALRAHQIWCEQGCPHGHDVDNWHQAELQLREEYARNGIDSRIPASEDVTGLVPGTGAASLEEDAPLGTKVEDELEDIAPPPSRRSPTSM